AKKFFIARLAAAEHGDLDAALDQRRKDVFNQIETLLRREARDHGDKRHIVFVGKVQGFSEGFFASAFPGETVFTVVVREKRIRPRIPQMVIDAVKNAHESACALAQDAVQTESLLQ